MSRLGIETDDAPVAFAPSPGDNSVMARVLLGLGSNLGDRRAALVAARDRLAALPGTRLIASSSIYETEPVGPIDQDDFLNAAAAIETDLEPHELHAELKGIESVVGRAAEHHRRPQGPRELDIDILLYDDREIASTELTIPHPRMHERRFVLEPLAEIAPDAVHARLEKTVAELLEVCADYARVNKTDDASTPSSDLASKSLRINEIFYSIQGESTRAGEPCVFVRLTGCHLRCGYCDTEYAFHEGERMTLAAIVDRVSSYACNFVEITGGEPLLQPNVHALMTALCDGGKTVFLETSGGSDISTCDPRVVRIMDLKTPGSGEVERNIWSNIDALAARDEVKFVLCDRADYDWMKRVLDEHDLAGRVAAVLVSAAHEMPPGDELPGCDGLSIRDLAEWILADRLPVRLQTQLHKLIWDPAARGV